MGHSCALGAPSVEQIHRAMEQVRVRIAGPYGQLSIAQDSGILPAVQIPTLGPRPCTYVEREPAASLEDRIQAHLAALGVSEDRARPRRAGCYVRYLRLN